MRVKCKLTNLTMALCIALGVVVNAAGFVGQPRL
jgi:hypothetical protein